jgi:hypothetical protein
MSDTSGPSSPESWAKYDPASRCWRTWQGTLLSGLDEFLATWPTSGTMRNGECFPQAKWAHHTPALDCSFLPTPQAVDGPKWYRVLRHKAVNRLSDGRQEMLIHALARLKEFPNLKVYVANPPFWEMAMGFPLGWTDLRPPATP